MSFVFSSSSSNKEKRQQFFIRKLFQPTLVSQVFSLAELFFSLSIDSYHISFPFLCDRAKRYNAVINRAGLNDKSSCGFVKQTSPRNVFRKKV